MRQSTLTLELPEDLYERVRRAAHGMKQPVEKALVSIVKAATPSLEHVPVEYRRDLEDMEELGDDELWNLAEKRLLPAKQRSLANLLHKNQRTKLTGAERKTLTRLRTEADRVMLKRSYAYLLLKYRGHRLPNLGEMRP